MSKIIGIDLGTTNSYVAVMEGGEPTAIANAEGVRTTPSIVAFTKIGERLIGEPTKRQAVTSADKTISSIKRHMGTDYRVDIDGKKCIPQEISAMILQKLKANTESYPGKTVIEVVITVPAYFNDAQRQATKDAGRIAGLDVKRIINEPTAAVLAYRLGNEKKQKIMVYDLSGGTFDVSIIEIGDSIIEVLFTNGDTRLGGDNFDNAIISQIIFEFKKVEGMNPPNNKMALQRLKEAAEKARKELSAATTTNINLPFITTTAEGSKHLDMSLTRARPDELTHDLVEHTAIPVQSALKGADTIASELGKVLLVGGSTCMIIAQEKVKQLTDKESNKSLNPSEYVAIDVATQDGKLAGDVGARGILLPDVTPLSLSIETMGGVATRPIERNTIISIKENQIFSAIINNQTAADIHVAQSERQFARDNRISGQLRLDRILSTRRGAPQIEITLGIDVNDIVNVSTKDLGIDREQRTTIISGFNMSDNDTDKAVKEAAECEIQDRKHKEAIDVRNDVDSMIFQTERVLEEVGDKITPGNKAEVKADLNSLKEAINRAPAEEMTNIQVEGIKAGGEKLMNSAQKLLAKVYEQVQASDAVGQAGPDMGGAGNVVGGDDTVDTDFKEA